jgi:hypothetical protein
MSLEGPQGSTLIEPRPEKGELLPFFEAAMSVDDLAGKRVHMIVL